MSRVGFSTVEFFASSSDFISLSELIFQLGLSPVEHGLLPSDPERWNKLADIRLRDGCMLGEWAKGPDANHNLKLLLVPVGQPVHRRAVPQKREGRVLHVNGLQENPDSLYLSAGGIDKNQCLIPSLLTCLSSQTTALVKFKEIKKLISKQYTMSSDGHYWLGPGALQRRTAGTKICTDSRYGTEVEAKSL